MSEIEWDNSLSVGLDLIDDQHKMLIERLNNLSCAVSQNKAVNEIMKTLEFMSEYTEFHFGTEEKHMAELGYPKMDQHIAMHNEFKKSLKTLEEDFDEEGATSDLSRTINTYLINWLIKHIKSVDVDFGTFLKEKGF